jgi:nicotinic acid mononucleotide adenylyltransferase
LEIETGSGEEIPRSDVEVRSFLLHDAAGNTASLYLLPGLNVEISASQIREQVREQLGGQPRKQANPGAATQGDAPQLLPSAVFSYIRAHRLYR